MRRFALPLLLALAATAAGASPERPQDAATSGARTVRERLGVAGYIPGRATPADEASRLARLRVTAEVGCGLYRTDLPWAETEPHPGVFDPGPLDRRVEAARGLGLEVVAILCYGTPWANDSADPLAPPRDPADFGAYAGRVAAHLRGRVRRYEIWNEPNVGPLFWHGTLGGDPAGYARLLAAASRAVREADPAAEIAIGGTMYPDVGRGLVLPGTVRFLESLGRADPGIGAAADAVAFHPYRYPFTRPEWEAPGFQDSLETALRRTRAASEALGVRGAPWITEIGWHTAWFFPGVTPADQARYLVRSAAIALASGVAMYCWYTATDGPDSRRWQEDAFGLVAWDPDPADETPPEPKPAFHAYRTFLALCGDATEVRAVEAPRGVEAVSFEAPGGTVCLVWAPERPRSVGLPVPEGARVTVIDYLGRPAEPIEVGEGFVAVRATADPLYVVFE